MKSSWNETTADWDSLSDQFGDVDSEDAPFSTLEDRLANTRIQIGIEQMMSKWLLGVHPNHGTFWAKGCVRDIPSIS